MDRSAAPLIDARATERLMELETADVDVPAPPGVAFHPPLYFRILAVSASALRIELWELGRPYGARSVSTVGGATLKARRIALAAAELARRLRQQRLVELDAESAPKAAAEEAKRAPLPIYGRFTFGASFQGASLGVSSAWLVGPAAFATLRFGSGPRLSLGAAWLAGAAPVFGGDASVRYVDVSLSALQGFTVAPSLELSAGLSAAVSAVRIGEPSGPTSAALDTWSSRATVLARADLRLARVLSLGVGPDVGVILTPISSQGSDGENHRLAGLWLGGALTLTVDPDAPP